MGGGRCVFVVVEEALIYCTITVLLQGIMKWEINDTEKHQPRLVSPHFTERRRLVPRMTGIKHERTTSYIASDIA